MLDRYRLAVERHPADSVVRLTGDCPLVDPALVVAALDLHSARGADYTSNTLVRTYPDGLDVEVLAAPALAAAAAEATDQVEREHVTPFVYRRPARFRLAALRGAEPLGDERWTVDTAADLADLRAVVARVGSPVAAGWPDLLAAAGRRRGPVPHQLWLRPLEPADAPALSRIGRGPPPDVTADPIDPALRAWVAELDAQPVGWLAVSVDQAEGHLRTSVSVEHQTVARRLLADRLAADRQVVELVETG